MASIFVVDVFTFSLGMCQGGIPHHTGLRTIPVRACELHNLLVPSHRRSCCCRGCRESLCKACAKHCACAMSCGFQCRGAVAPLQVLACRCSQPVSVKVIKVSRQARIYSIHSVTLNQTRPVRQAT